MARLSGAKKVYLASAAPEVRYPNVYGIDMPTKAELIANDKNAQQIAAEIGADGVVYQDLQQLINAVSSLNPAIQGFDSSCFNGQYLAGNIDEQYLDNLAQQNKTC